MIVCGGCNGNMPQLQSRNRLGSRAEDKFAPAGGLAIRERRFKIYECNIRSGQKRCNLSERQSEIVSGKNPVMHTAAQHHVAGENQTIIGFGPRNNTRTYDRQSYKCIPHYSFAAAASSVLLIRS